MIANRPHRILVAISVAFESPTTLDRFIGCILGHAIGDATGAPFEGMPATAIHYDFGGSRKIVDRLPMDVIHFTDDTQMSIGVMETLIECGTCDPDVLLARFAANYDPKRGYGTGARRILEAVRRGEDGRAIAESIFPGGSLGNGAAMRAAPIGLFFHDDLGRVSDEATRSALPTHQHLVGMDGARMLALAVALAFSSAGGPFDRDRFFNRLIGFAGTDEFREQLERAATLGPRDGIASLGHTLEAHRSVVTAIACFAFDPDNYRAVIARAIGLGDDCDTLAAMAGACSGARLGKAAIPTHLLERFEPGPPGVAELQQLAIDLHSRTDRSG